MNNTTLNLNEVPTYIKNSEVYKKLIDKNITYININDKLLLLISKKQEINIETFIDFANMLHTIYFWKIEPSSCPVEFFIYINKNLENSICQMTNFDLFNYVTKNNIKNIDILFFNFLS